MLRQMPSRLLSEWTAYCNLEPFGEERADYRAAMGVAATYNVWRDKGQAEIDPADVMPQFGAEPEEEKKPSGVSAQLKRTVGRFLSHGKEK